MWKVMHIYEADYGCEERQPGEGLMCLVELMDENGKRKNAELPDEWIRSHDIEEGSILEEGII